MAQKLTIRSCGAVRTPTSSAAARGHLSDYCSLHDMEDQELAALMAAPLVPVAKHDRIQLQQTISHGVFHEPGIESNICGIWLQDFFAFLNQLHDDSALSPTLIRRNPDIGALWVGAFTIGAYHKWLQRTQAACPATERRGIADVDYDDADSKDEDLEMVTGNTFIWLWEEDGLREQENI
ncbi:immunoglobulin variable region used by the ITC63B heavy chain [Fusarium phyllophilum]|uniref:Immunoglobulin variable region used by the ITC63B heavy chain n=1 Tax=Fusarium phyllophilum TaxID=47803 RepID=A0A8H5KC09_9HYPO|nr:immunoglobulin variable region used by the ITC63B heavy chain [Fusarium phyllophilum]